MSTQDKIQRLTESLLKLSSSVTLSDAIDSDSDKNAGIAASPKAVSTLASVILEAAKNASEGSDGETQLPLLGEVKHEIGSWWFSIDGSIPTGGLPHLGHLVSRSAYGTGWTWIETNKTVVTDEEWLAYAESHNGTCPYYSYGDGSTTFRTPSYDQSFLKVLASISGAGSVEEAGLPDHKHDIYGESFTVTGDSSGGNLVRNRNNSSTLLSIVTRHASADNPIYGNSDTVTPQNYGIIVGIYLVGAVSSPIGETDAAGLLNGLSTLESRTGALENGNGFNSIGKAEIVGWGMPDYSAGVSATFPYTAPCDGILHTSASGSGTSNILSIDNAQVANTYIATSYGQQSSLRIFVPKGKTVMVSEGSWNACVFFPLKGAN